MAISSATNQLTNHSDGLGSSELWVHTKQEAIVQSQQLCIAAEGLCCARELTAPSACDQEHSTCDTD